MSKALERTIAWIAALAMITIWILVGFTLARAEYKGSTKSDVVKAVTDFYRAEQGNRLTEYGITGLLVKIEQVFKSGEVPAPKPESETPSPAKD